MWLSDTRTGAASPPVGGHDTVQFGYFIDIPDLTVKTSGTGSAMELVVELAPVTEGGAVEDSITIENWNTPKYRVEEFRFANGFALDVSGIGHAKTGGDTDDTMSTSGVSLRSGDGVWLSGRGGDDTLTGSSRDDILIGGRGTDRLVGGSGDDVYVYARGDGDDTIRDTGSRSVGSNRADPGGDKLVFGPGITIEDLVLQRSGNTMKIHVGDTDDMTVPLADLDDTVSVENWHSSSYRIEMLQFFDGLDFDVSRIVNTYLGTDLTGTAPLAAAAADTLNGSSSGDWIDGFAGDDILNGNAGDDFIFGRDGDDTMNGGSGNDLMTGGDGDDTMDGGTGHDVLTGGGGNDTVNGGTGKDVVFGGSGNDTLDGGGRQRPDRRRRRRERHHHRELRR